MFKEKLRSKVGSVRDVGTSLSVVGASGVEIPIKGCIKVPIKFGTDTINAFLIVDDRENVRKTERRQEYPLLLGCNVLRALVKDVDLVFSHHGRSTPESKEMNDVPSTVRLATISLFTVRRVECRVVDQEENVFLPPCQSVLIEVMRRRPLTAAIG